MGSKLLQAVGVLAILGLVGGSIAALALVKQRIHVSIAAEEAASQRGPDPIELLRADVGAVAGDLAAFNENLGKGFQELHDSLESSASEREQKLAARVDALEAKLGAMQTGAAQSRAALLAGIAALSESLAQVKLQAASAPVQVAEAAPPVVTEVPSEVVTPPPAPEIAPTPVALAPPASPPKKGFLAFQLPSSAFAFDQRQRFAIVPALSRVGFDAKSTLHDFSGVTTKVDGNLSVNLAKASEKPLGTITVEAKSLDTGLADRDVDMKKSLGVEQFKTMTFEWSGFTATAVDAKAMTVAGTATGKLTIRGKSRDVSMPVKVSVDASKRVAIDGELTIKLSDYDVVPPSQLGVIKVEDELKLWIALRARLMGLAKEGE